MTTPKPDCPPPSQLQSLLRGHCDPTDEATLESHINECPDCQSYLADLPSSGQWEKLISADLNLQLDTAAQGDTDTGTGLVSTAHPLPAIDGYTLTSKLGQGGMGTVYAAHQHSLNRTVALKVLGSTAMENPKRWLRFQTEVEAIGRLQHPHIVRVFDAGESHGRAYVAQELCDRESLEQKMTTPHPPEEVVTMMRQLADAVHHAHEQGVLHRDIKPANVLFAEGAVKLVDFGLAKLTDLDDRMTRTRDVMGSPSYMAPEQARADHDSIDRHTDVYQLGILMYELLTGVAPFLADSAVETLRLTQEHEPVPPRQLQPSVPRDLQTICLKCLEKKTNDRYRTAAALNADLERLQSGHPIHARPPGLPGRVAKWTRRHPALAALWIVTTIATITLLMMWARFTADLQEQTRIAGEKTEEARENLLDAMDSTDVAYEVMDFFTIDLLEAADPKNDGVNVRVIDVIDQAAARVEEKFGHRPRVEAIVQLAISNMYFKLDRDDLALPHAERSVALFRQIDEPVNQQYFSAHYQLALCLRSAGRYDEFNDLLTQVAPLASQIDQRSVMEVRFTQMGELRRTQGLAAALPVARQLYADCISTLGRDATTTCRVNGSLATMCFQSGEIDEAVTLSSENLEVCQAVGDEPGAASAMNVIAVALNRQGKFQEAEAIQRDALERRRRLHGDEAWVTTGLEYNLASTIWRQGRHQEAVDTIRRVLAIRIPQVGTGHVDILEATFQATRMYLVMKQPQEAENLCDEILAPQLATRPATGQWCSLLTAWAEAKTEQGQLERASELLSRAEEIFSENPAAENPSRAGALRKARGALNAARTDSESGSAENQ
ncbi:MAG: serine/threonine-protein kinase [Planctomycetaceae bacterium]|nr:serine/threonine-protein kinase [Planctomycetaceae bacterium]